MEVIKGKTANELFINCLKVLIKQPEINPRGLKTKEIYNAWLELDNPLENKFDIKERPFNYKYFNGEMNWYKSGSLNVKDIEIYSSFWSKLADNNGTVNSNYGFITKIQKFSGKNQIEWCLDRLKKDKYTRQALINYNQPCFKYDDVKDFVCTISQQFVIRNDRLDTIVLMRSNDLFYGLTYDLPWFVSLQQELAEKLKIKIGKYYHYACSLHIYEKHFDIMENIINRVETDEEQEQLKKITRDDR